MKPKNASMSVDEIPEVQEFMAAEQRIQEFKDMYPGLFEELEELVEQRNALEQAAEQKVRAMNVSCGPFDRYQVSQKYNAEKFFDAMGREDFLKMGGTIEQTQKFSIDKKVFDSMAAQGKIPKHVVEAVKTESPSYHVPDKIVLP